MVVDVFICKQAHCKVIDISFICLTYNQEGLVLDHLESLRVVVEKYLKNNYIIELIIADDGSSDGTLKVIKDWIDNHSFVFNAIKIVSDGKNRGTCKNFSSAIRACSGRMIKFLAGDDIYLDSDISVVFQKLNFCDVVLTPTISFTKHSEYIEGALDKMRFNIDSYANRPFVDIKSKMISAPATPGVFINKNIYSDEILDFIEQFDLIEDRSFWLKALQVYENLKIESTSSPIIAYRYHNFSVSKQKKSLITNRFLNDQAKLTKLQIYLTKSLLYKFIYFYEYMFLVFGKSQPKFLNLQALIFNVKYKLFVFKMKFIKK